MTRARKRRAIVRPAAATAPADETRDGAASRPAETNAVPIDAAAAAPGGAPGARRGSTEMEPLGDLRRTFRLVRRFVAGQRRTFVTALGLLILEAGTSVFEAYPLAYLIDYLRRDRPALDVSFLPQGDVSTIAMLTIAIVLVAMLNSAADSGAEIYLAKGGQTLGYKLRVALFGHLQRLSLAYHDRRRTGDVITRVTGDVKEVEEFITDSVSDVIGSFLLLFGVLGVLLFNSWEVTLVGVVMIPICAFVSNYFAQRIKKAAKEQRAREGDLASTTQEMLTSIRVVQTFGRTERGAARFGVESGQAMAAAYETARLEAWFGWVWSVLKAVAIGAVVWIGYFVVRLELGVLVWCVLLIDEMFKPVRKIIKEWNKIGKLFASVERIAEVLDREPTVTDLPGAVPAPRLEGNIEFRDVTFAYKLDPEDAAAGSESEQRRALTDVSFTVRRGEVVALVGHSGAGKTTIAQLLPRLYDPQEGAVLLDGHDVRDFTLASLREQIGVVLQDTVLFTGSVADNIAYGREGATFEDVVQAATQANALGFIERMPDGFDTELSERASNLSGGQRQRIAIARALIRDTPILILDEPTTGLDAESTDVVLKALRRLMHGKTTVLISHDLELIRTADRIIVLRSGRIEQEGTHDSLLADGGLYASLYATRTRGIADDAPLRTGEEGRPPRPSPTAPASVPAVRAGSGTAGALDDLDGAVDPLRSVRLREELPQLGGALDHDRMRRIIGDALLGRADAIEDCRPGKASYIGPGRCIVRYEVDIARSATSRGGRALVGAHVFSDGSAASTFVRERLEPLAVAARNGAGAPFRDRVAEVREVPMALYAFPIDPDLPTLVDAADATHMIEVLRSTAGDAFEAASSIDSCRVEIAHYPRRNRCVLRYVVDGRHRTTLEGSSRVIYGKVRSGGWGDADASLRALRDGLAAAGDPFEVPRLLAVRPELGLALFDTFPGTPPIAGLLREVGAPAEGFPSLADAVVECARIAAALHALDVPQALPRTWEDEVADLTTGVATIRRFAPPLGERLDAWVGSLQAFAGDRPAVAPRLAHGDLTHSQVAMYAGESALLDLDTLCLAEPALDLGTFCAYLRVACRATAGSESARAGDELCGSFVDHYLAVTGTTDGELVRARVTAYEALTLARMAVRSWHQLKAKRVRRVVSVLQERMACLER